MLTLKPLISVIIPTFNRKDPLIRAINSVLNQDYHNIEILVIDDGSEKTILDEVKKNYADNPFVQFYARDDSRPKGANACRNTGIRVSKGDYLSFLDSDDVWERSHLSNLLKDISRQNNFHGAYTNTNLKKTHSITKVQTSQISSDTSPLEFLLSGRLRASTCTYFLTKQSAEKILFDEQLQRHQDYDFFIRFQEALGWTYIDSTEVTIFENPHPTYSCNQFESFIYFYKKHKSEFLKSPNANSYIFQMYKTAIMSNNKEAASFYKKKYNASSLLAYLAVQLTPIYKTYLTIKQKIS